MRSAFEYHIARPEPRNRDRNGGWLENATGMAMILSTPVGSRVLQKSRRPGDTGACAEALAQRLGVVVVAYQDLGPTTSYPGMRVARRRPAPREPS